jgi:hypothetical protein
LTGGFWEWRVPDSLRINVLTLLRDRDLQVPDNFNSQEALDAFVAGGFFLVHTLKWPIANKKTYNKLGPAQKRRLVGHAAPRHLQNEIKTLAPKGILAMGNAAWDACRRLSADSNLPAAGVEDACGRKDLFMNFLNRKISINASRLPTDYNLNTRLPLITRDLENFLDRHHWQQLKPRTS